MKKILLVVCFGLLAFGLAIWASVALGSFVFLAEMGYSDEFEFPYNQLVIALPYIIGDGWHAKMQTWTAVMMGIMAAIAPAAVIVSLIMRSVFVVPQPPLFGRSAWATQAQMRRSGIRSFRRLF